MRRLALPVLGALVLGVTVAAAGKLPQAPACPVFPATSPWNQRVDGLSVHPHSDTIVRAIGVDGSIHPDFGSGR